MWYLNPQAAETKVPLGKKSEISPISLQEYGNYGNKTKLKVLSFERNKD